METRNISVDDGVMSRPVVEVGNGKIVFNYVTKTVHEMWPILVCLQRKK